MAIIKLWEVRTAKGLKLEAVAALTGVSKSTLNNIENGKTSPTLAKRILATKNCLTALYTEDERKVKKMSEDKAKEIIAESVAKEVVESIGEDLAGALVEYANLVKELAADLTYEKVRVICTETRLKEVGVKQKHIKHILGKIGTVKEIRTLPDMDILAYFVHFRYINLKAAPGNKKPYYVFLEDMIEPINLEVIEGNKGNE